MTLAEELQRQLDESRQTIARYENARLVMVLEIARLKLVLGETNKHPASVADLRQALSIPQ